MTHTAHILLWLLACLVSAPLWVLSVQCLLGLFNARRRGADADATPRLAVLVPAHNEEPVIGATLDSLKAALPDDARIVVIADNCTDRTAQVARGHGVQVIERTDPAHRGKGFALAAGLDTLHADSPQVVIIVDADCTVSANALTDLAKTAHAANRPAQGVYLMTAPDPHDARAVVSAFAFMVKNQARPRGMDLLNLPVPLTGSGMAFAYEQLRQANLATGNIVEDLALGLELAQRGHGPVLCNTARITAALPGNDHAAVTQRTRWEHGYLSTLVSTAPRLLTKGLFRLRPSLIAAAVDLAVPPLSLLVLGAAAAWAVTLVIGWWIGAWAPAVMIGLSLALTAVALGLCWAAYARHRLPARALLAIPGYVLWKLPIYLRFLRRRETRWVRTQRDPQPPDAPDSAGGGTSGR